MRTYGTVFSLAWQNGFVYRASVLLWRLRQFLSTFLALTFWTVVYTTNQQAVGYTQSEMMGYIFITSILQSLVLSSALNGLTSMIYSGELSIVLLKPLSAMRYFAILESADKLKNVFFAFGESLILYWIFSPSLSGISWSVLPIFALWLLGGILLNFFITILFGCIGFWSPDSWGPRMLFITITTFTTGRFFPLDILPSVVQQLVWLTPFPFLTFAPTQVLLGRLSLDQIMLGSIGLLIWLVVLLVASRTIWRLGTKSYSAMGQ